MRANASGRAGGGRVMIVEHDMDMSRYLEGALAAEFAVRVVADGQAALDEVRQWSPELVLADVSVPGIGGFELLRRLRTASANQRLPVIMLTAGTGPESSIEALDAGADDYLAKPFSQVELLARVRSALAATRVREAYGVRAERRAERLGRLVDAGLRITSRVEPREVLEAVAVEARALFGAVGVEIIGDRGAREVAGSLEPAEHGPEVTIPFGEHGRVRLVLARGAEFGSEDRALCEQLAVVGAAALGRARLHAREHDTVLRLQEALLPRELPTDPDLQLTVRYLPANLSAEVGGDWYDVLALPGGRMAAIVGDVVGHGMEAAAAMSSLRSVLRAFLSEGSGPAEALARMHDFAGRSEIGLTATLCCLIVDPRTGRGEWASAGHPAPLLIRPDGTADYLPPGEGQQPALAVGARPPGIHSALSLEPGQTLLLFTDGLVERRDRVEGLDELRRLAASGGGDLDAFCDHLIDELAPEEARRDDVALLALRRNRPQETVLELREAADPGAPSRMRHSLRPWLARHQVDQTVTSDVLVAVSEAVANSVEHAGITRGQQVTVRARIEDGQLTITIRDGGRWRQERAEPLRGHGLTLMRALMDSVRVDPSDHGTRVELGVRMSGGGR